VTIPFGAGEASVKAKIFVDDDYADLLAGEHGHPPTPGKSGLMLVPLSSNFWRHCHLMAYPKYTFKKFAASF